MISRTQIDQAEADIKKELFHRQLENKIQIDEEEVKETINFQRGVMYQPEKVYVDHYQPVGQASEPELHKNAFNMPL